MYIISVLLIISCLFLLGSGRLNIAIRVAAAQGILLGILPLVQSEGLFSVGILVLSASTFISKGILLPWLMGLCLRNSGIRREDRPFVGFGASLLCGTGLLALAGWVTARMPAIPGKSPVDFLMASSFFLIFVGLFLMVTRRKALTQSLAYLILENGVYGIGVSMSLDFPFIVELGILLDVFVGVFLMGNLLFHLDREFEHMDVDRLTELSDVMEYTNSDREKVP
jgi:hydrogenase-4 component E